MSFGMMALEDIGVTVDKYYSSEIDKYAIQATQALFPDTIQLGDITQWRDWDIDWSGIDLVTGGFPCQAWSMAGKQLGDKDERGMLFWVMLDIMKHVKYHNPKVDFMIENVKMKREFEEYITTHTENALGKVHKILINSALVSAQNRNRYYWTSFPVEQPEDEGILLKDIVEGGTVDREKSLTVTTRVAGATAKRYLEKSMRQMVIDDSEFVDRDKSYCIDANYHKGGNPKSCFKSSRRQLVFPDKEACDSLRPCELRDTPPVESAICHHVATATDINANESNKRVYAETGKAPTVTTMGGGHREPKILVGRVVGRKINPTTGKRDDYNPDIKIVQRLEARPDEKSGCLTTVQKDDVLVIDPPKYRKLTPRECFRLQTVPEHHIDTLLNAGISNSQLYKMCGNGFTMKVISHILSHMK